MTAAPVTVRTMPELIDALRMRAHELDVAYRTVDDVAGLPDGYVSKLFAPKPIKNLGPLSFEPLLKALAVTLLVQPDPAQLAMLRHRLTRKKRHDPPRPTLASNAGIVAEQQVTPELQAKLEVAERMKRLRAMRTSEGQAKGGKRRMKLMKKRTRQALATHAARKRWGKRRA